MSFDFDDSHFVNLANDQTDQWSTSALPCTARSDARRQAQPDGCAPMP